MAVLRLLPAAVAVIFLAMGARAETPEPPEFEEPRDFFVYLRRSAPALREAVLTLQDRWPRLRQLAFAEMERKPAPVYTGTLRTLLEVPEKEEEPLPADPSLRLDFDGPARGLVGRVEKLIDQTGIFSGDEWRDELVGLHNDYARSLVAAYTALEMVKRAHLLANSPALLFGNAREKLLTAMETTHKTAQTLMESFRVIRTHKLLAQLMPHSKNVWEDRYGNAFHFRIVLNFRPSDGVYLARDIGSYFAALEGGEGTPPPTTTKTAEELKARYLALAYEIAKTENDAKLMAELEEVIRQLRALGVEPPRP